MEGSAIPDIDPTTIRMGCLQMATSLNEGREKPFESMAEVIADAELATHFVTNGQDNAFTCDPKLSRTVR